MVFSWLKPCIFDVIVSIKILMYNMLMKKLSRKKRLTTALVINIIIIICELYAHFVHFSISSYIMYTMISNALLLIVAIIDSVYLIRALKGAKNTNPVWLQRLRFMTTLSVAVTFIVTLTVLTWTTSLGFFFLMFGGTQLFLHTICPILATFSFITLRKYHSTANPESLYAMSFTLLYAAVFIPLNILKLFDGPYPFLMVYNQPVWATIAWLAVIIGGCYGLSRVILFLNQRIRIKNN